MAGTFNNGTYEIYWHKEQSGDTPFQPLSPQNEISTSPKNKASMIKTGTLIAMGITVAKRTINVVRSEIGASTGNERLQTNINNVMQLIGYGAAIAATGGVGIIYTGVDVALSSIQYHRELVRTNRSAKIERDLQGKRINIAKGSAYYG